jgi:hypothetical protein
LIPFFPLLFFPYLTFVFISSQHHGGLQMSQAVNPISRTSIQQPVANSGPRILPNQPQLARQNPNFANPNMNMNNQNMLLQRQQALNSGQGHPTNPNAIRNSNMAMQGMAGNPHLSLQYNQGQNMNQMQGNMAMRGQSGHVAYPDGTMAVNSSRVVLLLSLHFHHCFLL